MTKKQCKILWEIYSFLNKIGGCPDMTAINPIALMKYKQAHNMVAQCIYLLITEEDNEKLDLLVKQLDILSRWNFGDRNGNISSEEMICNKKLEEILSGWNPYMI